LINVLPALDIRAQYCAVIMASTGGVMGRVGRSYSRFEQPSRPPATPGREADCAFQTRVGAIIGVLCALGLIGWLMSSLAIR